MQTPGYIPDATELAFIDSVAPASHPILLEMGSEAERDGIPVLDRASGRILAALAAGRVRIVEVGTAIGYSTLCMAFAQPPAGTIVTLDPDVGRTDRARAFWRRAGVPDERIAVVNAPALVAFERADPVLDGPFDLAFLDAIKVEYAAYLDALVPRLRVGALVVADNVLYHGLVAGRRDVDQEGRGAHVSADAMRAFDAAVLSDPRFAAAILPVGDGLLVATYRGGDR
jgi:caffeoyl-CoA O-methyltransferase